MHTASFLTFRTKEASQTHELDYPVVWQKPHGLDETPAFLGRGGGAECHEQMNLIQAIRGTSYEHGWTLNCQIAWGVFLTNLQYCLMYSVYIPLRGFGMFPFYMLLSFFCFVKDLQSV